MKRLTFEYINSFKLSDQKSNIVGIVVRLDIYNSLPKKYDYIYVDRHQKEECVAFKSLDLLKSYLNRHDDWCGYVEMLTGINQIRQKDLCLHNNRCREFSYLTNHDYYYTACKHGWSYLACPACQDIPTIDPFSRK